jgi:hypothetical protein
VSIEELARIEGDYLMGLVPICLCAEQLVQPFRAEPKKTLAFRSGAILPGSCPRACLEPTLRERRLVAQNHRPIDGMVKCHRISAPLLLERVSLLRRHFIEVKQR